MAQQQQTIVNQQAVIMVNYQLGSVCLWSLPFHVMCHFLVSQAQQMTMQAMAMVGSPVSSPPTSPITSPPMSPLLHHPSSLYSAASPYAVIPPSPYVNIPPSPYANFTPTPYAVADIPPSPYLPSAHQGQTPSQPHPHPPSASQTESRAQPQLRAPRTDPQLNITKADRADPAQRKVAQVSKSETQNLIIPADIFLCLSKKPLHGKKNFFI